jgi:hypothetical protein
MHQTRTQHNYAWLVQPLHLSNTLLSQPLICRFLQATDVQGAGLLLTRAFAGTPEAVKLEEAM